MRYLVQDWAFMILWMLRSIYCSFLYFASKKIHKCVREEKMEKIVNRQEAEEFLRPLVGQPLRYALKSPDTELYDFGFGKPVEVTRLGIRRRIGTYSIHALCRFKVLWENSERGAEEYCENTPSEEFSMNIRHLIGREIMKLGLSEKNDLWLDMGDCRIVWTTVENGEESWRFLAADTNVPHLVVSNSWMELN